jgi:hypothetical protein
MLNLAAFFKDDGRKHKAVNATKKDYFAFLDMEMYWSPEGNLQFRVHLKENQVLKYLIRGSTHTETCFAAIPTGVMNKWWNNPVHAILKELQNKHGLTWLRMTMSYHKLSNLQEIFQGDLNRKVMDGIVSWDFMDQPCNCNRVSKIDGKCAYNGECR